MNTFTLVFSTRERYCRAVNAIWINAQYRMTCRGKVLGTGKWYVEFVREANQ